MKFRKGVQQILCFSMARPEITRLGTKVFLCMGLQASFQKHSFWDRLWVFGGNETNMSCQWNAMAKRYSKTWS